MISERARAFAEGNFLAKAVVFGGGEDLGLIVRSASGEKMIDDAGELVGDGGDGGRGAEFGAEAAEEVAERRMTGMEGVRGEAERTGGAGRTAGHFAADGLAAGNPRVWRKTQPGAEVFAGFESGELRPKFGDDGRGDPEVDAGDRGQIDPTDPVGSKN